MKRLLPWVWCVVSIMFVGRPADAADLPASGTPCPPLPLAQLRVGDWARWDGTQLSRTETLEVSHTLTVKEKTAAEIVVEHFFQNHTRDRVPENERTIWNGIPDLRVERRFSLASPPTSIDLLSGVSRDEGAAASGNTPAKPGTPTIKESSRKGIEAAGKPWNAMFLAFSHTINDDPGNPVSMTVREWRGEVPFGLLQIELGMDIGDIADDPEELEAIRREARAEGLTDAEIAKKVEETITLFRLLRDETVPMAEVAARALAMDSTKREMKKDGKDEKQIIEDLEEIRGELQGMAEATLCRWTLSAYGDAAKSPK